MAFVTIGTKKLYGPLSMDDEFTVERLTQGQIKYIYENFNGVVALMVSDNRCGLWQSQRARDNVGMLPFAWRTPTPSHRHIPSARPGPFARRGTSRLTRYKLSDRRGLTRHVVIFTEAVVEKHRGHLREGC